MQITRELRAKVDRLYGEKANKMRDEIREKIKQREDELRPHAQEAIELYLNDPEYSEDIRAAVAKAIKGCCGASATQLVLDKYLCEATKEMNNNVYKVSDKIGMEKEALLIALSYSSGIEQVKAIFAEYGLAF